jgi:very-short-patch-repair endonuclease
MDPDLRRKLNRVARRHHGIVTREDLEALGLTSHTIEWALDTHQLVVLFPGVYRVAGAPDTWHGRALAAQRRVERQLRRLDAENRRPALVVVGGAAAAHLHALRGHGRAPKLLVVTSRRSRSRAVAVGLRPSLTDADVIEVSRIPTTSVPWSAVEVAGPADVEERRDLLSHLVGTGKVGRGQLLGAAHRADGVAGRQHVVAELLAMAGPVDHYRSNTEKVVAQACRDLDLPEPAVNHEVATTSGAAHELDLAWPNALLDVEVDGPHHLVPSQRRRDRARDRDLRADGWEVARFPVEEVDEDPADVAQRIATILDRRATPAPAE